MRLFFTFKLLEVLLIISALWLLYSFQSLCREEPVPDLKVFSKAQKSVSFSKHEPKTHLTIPMGRGDLSSSRQRRNVFAKSLLGQPFVPSQTVIGGYRCEKALDFEFGSLWNPMNVYQKLFGLRFIAIGLLALHLLIIFIDIGATVSKTSKIPWLRKGLLGFGIFVWIVIDLWIGYQFITWDSQYSAAPLVPAFPEELLYFLMLSIFMLILLISELLFPRMYYDARYSLAARSEDDPYHTRAITMYSA